MSKIFKRVSRKGAIVVTVLSLVGVVVTAAVISMFMTGTVTVDVGAKYTVSVDGSPPVDMEDYTWSDTPSSYPGHTLKYNFSITCNDALGGVIEYTLTGETDGVTVTLYEDSVEDLDDEYTYIGATTMVLRLEIEFAEDCSSGSYPISLEINPPAAP